MNNSSKVFFTADTHFGHTNIIKYCNRPFANAQDMDEAIIHNWNQVVYPGDTVYHLGDFSFGKGEDWRRVRGWLNGDICLILGNHDKNVITSLFKWVKPYEEIEVEGQKIVLFHYGMRTWKHDLRGTWQLYGHSHGQLPPYGKSCDVGVDAWGFGPIAFPTLKRFMNQREIGPHPMF
jgi:calcineurin-like phosphoesterase family protein